MNKEIHTNNAKLLSFAAVAALLGAGFTTVVGVSAYGGPNGSMMDEAIDTPCSNIPSEERFERMSARFPQHEAIEEALENGDYDAWVEAHGDLPMRNDITEEQFSTLQDMHEAMEAGDMETVRALRDELGITPRGVYGQNGRGGMHRFFGR